VYSHVAAAEPLTAGAVAPPSPTEDQWSGSEHSWNESNEENVGWERWEEQQGGWGGPAGGQQQQWANQNWQGQQVWQGNMQQPPNMQQSAYHHPDPSAVPFFPTMYNNNHQMHPQQMHPQQVQQMQQSFLQQSAEFQPQIDAAFAQALPSFHGSQMRILQPPTHTMPVASVC